jgi:hypothetical protein
MGLARTAGPRQRPTPIISSEIANEDGMPGLWL